MPAPYFTQDASQYGRVEGLYINELSPPPTITGLSMQTVGLVGRTVRGPVDRPVDITSPAQFDAIFGGRDYGTGGIVRSEVWRMLLNKPFGRVVVVRVAAAASVTATANLVNGTGTVIARVDASSVGEWGNEIDVQVLAPSDGVAGHFDLLVMYINGQQVSYPNIDLTLTNDNSAQVIGTDLSNLIVLTKIAAGTPVIGGAVVSLAGGVSASVVDADYTATGRGLRLLENYPGVAVVNAGRMTAGVRDRMEIAAASATDRIFLMGPDSEATAYDSTDVASYRSDRLVYCFNYAYTRDPSTGLEELTPARDWMASILSQTDVDIHPGEQDTKRMLAGITRLYNEGYNREDYALMKAKGLAALEKSTDGFNFVSGITTTLEPLKREITRRRSADFLQLSIADELKYHVKKKNTPTRRNLYRAAMEAFLDDLQKSERIVESYAVDTEQMNTPAQRALGIEYVLLKVRLIGHALAIVLVTDISTGTVTELAAAA